MKIKTGKEKARQSGTHDEANAKGGGSSEHVNVFFEHGELPLIFLLAVMFHIIVKKKISTFID